MNRDTKTAAAFLQLLSLCRRRAIFPGRRQPSIVATDELNFRVRNGNGWTLIVISTDWPFQRKGNKTADRCSLSRPSERDYLSTRAAVCKERVSDLLKETGDPCGNRTHVWGVRGPRLNLLTNGPSSSRTPLPPFPPVAFGCRRKLRIASLLLLFKMKLPFHFEAR